MEPMPRLARSSAVSFGRTSRSMSLFRKTGSYCFSPRRLSHAPISTDSLLSDLHRLRPPATYLTRLPNAPGKVPQPPPQLVGCAECTHHQRESCSASRYKGGSGPPNGDLAALLGSPPAR